MAFFFFLEKAHHYVKSLILSQLGYRPLYNLQLFMFKLCNSLQIKEKKTHTYLMELI